VVCPSRISDRLRAWQAEWAPLRQLAERQASAARNSALALAALRDYSSAYRQNLNSHSDGVTVVAVTQVPRVTDDIRHDTTGYLYNPEHRWRYFRANATRGGGPKGLKVNCPLRNKRLKSPRNRRAAARCPRISRQFRRSCYPTVMDGP